MALAFSFVFFFYLVIEVLLDDAFPNNIEMN